MRRAPGCQAPLPAGSSTSPAPSRATCYENFKVLASGPNSVCGKVATGRARGRSIGAARRAGAEAGPAFSRRRRPRRRLCPATRDVAGGPESWAASTFFEISTSLKRQKIALCRASKVVISQADRTKTLDAVERQSPVPIQTHTNRSSAPCSNRHSYTCEGSLRRSSSALAGGGLGVPTGPRPSRFGLVPGRLAMAIEWLPGRDALRVSCKQSVVSSPPSRSPEQATSVVSNACTDLTLVLIGRPRCQGGPGLRVGSPEVGAGPWSNQSRPFAVAPLRVFFSRGFHSGSRRLLGSVPPVPRPMCGVVCDQRQQEPPGFNRSFTGARGLWGGRAALTRLPRNSAGGPP